VNLSLTLANIALKLSEMLQEEVKFVTDCIGEEVAKAAEELPKGKVLLLENVRFYPE
jgi:phosphoglycerate kinase